jgi:hypothetical protein
MEWDGWREQGGEWSEIDRENKGENELGLVQSRADRVN